MNKSYFTLILSFLILVHFFILHFLGISFFSTTLLFYYLIYKLIKKLISNSKINNKRKTILFNIKAIIIICLIFEFFSTFIIKILNNPVENEIGVYFSPYMRSKQIKVLYKFGFLKSNRNTTLEAYKSNYKHQHESVDFNYKVSYNKYGFRGKFPDIKKDSNEFRIICLGDSFVEGFGTSNDSTFPVLLEKYLSLNRLNVSVLNGGICGSNPLHAIRLYDKKLKNFDPDLVIIELNDGDWHDINFNLSNESMSLTEHFYAVSHLFRITYSILYRVYSSLHFDFSFKFTDLFRPEKTLEQEMAEAEAKAAAEVEKKFENINTILDSLTEFKQKLNYEKRQLAILYLPFQNELFESNNTITTSALTNRKIPFIDLREPYKQSIRNNPESFQKYYWKNDGHHTPTGYDLMGRTVAEKLILENYIKKYPVDTISIKK